MENETQSQNNQQEDWVCLDSEKEISSEQPQTIHKGIDFRQEPHSKWGKKDRPHKKFFSQKLIMGFAGVLAGFIGLYCLLVFSHISVIERWRTIYIETAMGTMTHQWLATAFLPQSVIDEVMNGRTTIELQQDEYNSEWTPTEEKPVSELAIGTWDIVKDSFAETYPEIEPSSFWAYLAARDESDYIDEDGYLLIDKADYDEEETGIQTIYGDSVCAIDTRNGIVIVGLKGSGYAGRMAIVKDPSMMNLALSENFGESGDYLKDICEDNNAVLGINASGFGDANGQGNGGYAIGLVYSDFQTYMDTLDETMKVIGMSTDNRLSISNSLESGTRDAMQFSPALVVNGIQLISGSSGWGLQPRSVIAQTEDGQMLLSIVDGRQPGYSIGITIGDLTDILYEYGAYQACNLDGGSSAIMYYNGRNITRSSATTPTKGRHIPNAWIVKNSAASVNTND